MKRYFPILTLAFALVIGAAIAPDTGRSVANADANTPSHSDLFAPAKNFIIHDLNTRGRKDLRCLALNIYWESRSEPVAGQIAVASVTMNRVRSSRFPDSICDVVRQGGEIRRHRCQFSWWCDGKKDKPLEVAAWRRANTLARLAYAGVMDDPTDGALWYHADYVKPRWAKHKQSTVKIGRHIFYVLPPAKLARSENDANEG